MLKQSSKDKVKLWESVWGFNGGRASSSYGPYFTANMDMENKRVLELGCGDLTFSRYNLIDMKYAGLDIAGRALKGAMINFPNGSFVQADATVIPFKDMSFDVVFAIETITCAGRDADGILKEASRVLSNKGTLLFDVVHADLYRHSPNHKPYVEEIGRENYGTLLRGKITGIDLIVYDEQEISGLLRESGLGERQIRAFTIYEHENMGVPVYQRMPKGPYDDVKSSILVTAAKS